LTTRLPVLSALGARTLIESIYAVDTCRARCAGRLRADAALIDRLDQSLAAAATEPSPCATAAPCAAHRPCEVAVRLHC
jgi:hypothetical protein